MRPQSMHTYSLRGKIGHLLMRVFGLLPLQDIAVFQAFDGKMYGDNPRALYEEMLKRNLPMRYVWLLRDTDTKICGAKVVRSNSVLSLYYLSIARLWVDCSRKREWVVKRKRQTYVQTWHGDICLKRIERDAEESLPPSYIASAINDSNMCDLMLSGSKFSTSLMKGSFWYHGEVFESGQPKNDVFFQDRLVVQKRVRRELCIGHDRDIVLYVPTFRNDASFEAYLTHFERILDAIGSSLANPLVLVRLHPKLTELHYGFEYNDDIIDASLYPSTNDLILSSSLVITDYSSCMFDAMEANVPVCLYIADKESYMQDRGMYFDISTLPFPYASSLDELVKLLNSISLEKILHNQQLFKEQMCSIGDGLSSVRAVNKVLELLSANESV